MCPENSSTPKKTGNNPNLTNQSGYLRKETYDGYKSYVKIMREYISKKRPTYYVYQFDRKFCVDFLDYVFIERNNGAQTRNNYLSSVQRISNWFNRKIKIILSEYPDAEIVVCKEKVTRLKQWLDH